MKKYLIIPIFILIISCSGSKGVYWCGDHPCINDKEKKAYFKSTMIVEVRNYDKDKISSDSEIQKLLNQAKLDEKKRILTKKELEKKIKLEEKELAKKIKLEEKKNKIEEKELAKQIKLEEKKNKIEEKELAKQIKLEEKRKTKDEKELQEIVKIKKKNTTKKKMVENVLKVENIGISEKKFDELVKKIIMRNNSRPYPDINDIPK